MKERKILIVGGGLAGLTAAIHLASYDFEVCLIEKESYPHHKVCGEYLSKEILSYFDFLNLSLDELKPVEITNLEYSNQNGKTIKTILPLGGLGISRYSLDYFLYKEALKAGVIIHKEVVASIQFYSDNFITKTISGKKYYSHFLLGAFGKRSNLDKQLNRSFINNKSGWLAVKSHYSLDSFPENTVALHNFKGGYCGLSKVESGAVNVCYLAAYNSFKKYKDTQKFKEEVLTKNPHLKKFFSKAKPIFSNELSIAQVSFDNKSIVKDHIFMLGDAAGLIHPLCGNGMAMAIHSAGIAAECILKYYSEGEFSRQEIEIEYTRKWNEQFKTRLRTGRILQKLMLHPSLSRISQNTIQLFPGLLNTIISKTHGLPK